MTDELLGQIDSVTNISPAELRQLDEFYQEYWRCTDSDQVSELFRRVEKSSLFGRLDQAWEVISNDERKQLVTELQKDQFFKNYIVGIGAKWAWRIISSKIDECLAESS